MTPEPAGLLLPDAGRAPLTDRGRRTRDALVAAARQVFEERGFPATRMSDIAEAAGVSHGTVYTWFDTKEDLLNAVVAGVVASLYDALRVPDAADPVTRVERANRSYLDAYRHNARLLEVVEQVATTDERLRTLLAGLRRTHVERVTVTVRRLQAERLADPDLDAETAAAALCAMVEGFARHWLGRGEPHDERTAVAVLTTCWARALALAPAPIRATARAPSAPSPARTPRAPHPPLAPPAPHPPAPARTPAGGR